MNDVAGDQRVAKDVVVPALDARLGQDTAPDGFELRPT